MESPIPRRFSVSSSVAIPNGGAMVHDIENVINSYEAEEERIVNVLSRKLEQLREEKSQLEYILEAEAETHGNSNRHHREHNASRHGHPQLAQSAIHSATSGSSSAAYDSDNQNYSISSSPIQQYHPQIVDPRLPSVEVMLQAIRRDNELLRARLYDTERDHLKLSRQNDLYREELIELRRKLGLSLDDLLLTHNVASSSAQPSHHRQRDQSISPVVPTHHLPLIPQRPSPGPLPIPRPPSQIHRPPANTEARPALPTTSMITSASSPDSSTPASPFPFSPLSSSMTSPGNTGYQTTLTTPASVPPLSHIPPTLNAPNLLTYPHVPPPSLSSSLGSPVAMFSPVNAVSRRNSRVAETGLVRRGSSVDRHSRPAANAHAVHGRSIAELVSDALTSQS